MSLWQFTALVAGYDKAHASEDEQALATHEIDNLTSLIEAPPVWQ